MWPSRYSSEQGSAVVEFVLLIGPALLIGLSVIALVLAGFARSLLLDAAIEGARFAALADQDSAGGCSRAISLMRSSLGPNWQFEAQCRQSSLGGVSTEIVLVSLQFPSLGFLPKVISISEEAHAQREDG